MSAYLPSSVLASLADDTNLLSPLFDSNTVTATLPLATANSIALHTNDNSDSDHLSLSWATGVPHNFALVQLYTTSARYQAARGDLDSAVFDVSLLTALHGSDADQWLVPSDQAGNITVSGCFSALQSLPGKKGTLVEHCVAPFQLYLVSVRLVGSAVPTERSIAHVRTAAAAPTSPLRNVRVTAVTATSVSLRARIPEEANGIVESLLVELEEALIPHPDAASSSSSSDDDDDESGLQWVSIATQTVSLPISAESQMNDPDLSFDASVADLHPHRKYRARIRASTAAGVTVSVLASTAEFETAPTAPRAPELLRAVVVPDSNVPTSTPVVVVVDLASGTTSVEDSNAVVGDAATGDAGSGNDGDPDNVPVFARVSWVEPTEDLGFIEGYEVVVSSSSSSSSSSNATVTGAGATATTTWVLAYQGLNETVYLRVPKSSSISVRARTVIGWGAYAPPVTPQESSSSGQNNDSSTLAVPIGVSASLGLVIIILGVVALRRKEALLDRIYGFKKPEADEFEILREQVQLTKMVDAGAFGEVYIATGLELLGSATSRTVAVKVCQGSHITNKAKRAFVKEMDLMKRVSHPETK